ncbi:GNAT family N-acetyltransferase [Pediococcus damnosus]|uniref:GNAT family N-acetyltransferase n=1 Tax=Pediococcus damnosus TaxID=51663 RepID=UPI00061EB0BA|nr:GNAT family N-acetyltransferase [Pediococcus damnosus]KJU73711.1 acetyltransferase [Pediococcus damnosus LMG 28219]PIO81781.1 GNAT family N-acetyltransferase [Pediococcus damnosus]PIO84663.1 GNAT family N-acetyltransferase [Pediococcus damnosus]PJE48694.1 GNAT family N-acetyltransferase [Pediococcus damnosus]
MEIKRILKYTSEHYTLLLSADPQISMVETYLQKSRGFQMTDGESLVGVVVLTPINSKRIELKNIAINSKYQHRGLAQTLIKYVLHFARQSGFTEMVVGTGSTSFEQLYLYQKMGFRCFEIRTNFFSDNYAKPIIENGLRLRDMILLRRVIDND